MVHERELLFHFSSLKMLESMECFSSGDFSSLKKCGVGSSVSADARHVDGLLSAGAIQQLLEQ